MVGTPGGGYVVFGNWHGYAWTATEDAKMSTLTPADFSAVTTNGPLCVKGSVAATTDYSGFGMVGVNLNQAGGMDMPKGTVTPTSTGISVNVTNNSPTTPLRIQVQGPQGDAAHRWCADIVGSGGFFPWASLTTTCWDAKSPGTPYDKSPIESVVVEVPGSNTAAIPFDFCLNTLSEGDGTGGGVCDPKAAPVTGSTSVWDGGSAVCGADGQQYFIWNNAWGSRGSAQSISWSGTSFQVTAQSASGGGVQGYPSIFIGSINVHKTLGSNLPKQVSTITQVPTSWSWTGASGEYNAAYDVWFNSSNVTDLDKPSGGFLMIWLHKPGSQNPIGGSPSQSNVSVGGGTWNIYTGDNGGTPCISYVATSDINTWTGDIAAFITHAKTVQGGNYMKDSWYLANVFAGFEIWSGGQGLKTNSFSAIVK
jgi:hypothetical protein